MFLPLICLVSVVLAEPPIGDGYPASRSNDHHRVHHDSNHQQSRSLSQKYGPPVDNVASARNSPSDGYEYNAPSAKSSLNTRGRSQYPPPSVRVSFNQRFTPASSRNSGKEHNAPDARSQQGYAASSARSGISQEYGAPATRSLSQEYGTPTTVSGRALSAAYDAPNARSSPSQEYGVPAVETRSHQNVQSPAFNFRKAQAGKPQEFSAPAARSQSQTSHEAHGFTSPALRSNTAARAYDASKPDFTSRSVPSSKYGTPASHGATAAKDSNSQELFSQTRSSPSQSGISETYGTPNARGLSQEYGVPSSRTNLMTETGSSLYTSSRSSPSSTYLPASRSSVPSEQYGVPEQRDATSQGYDYARSQALEELQNQEPANYDFAYQIEDQESGSDFGHSETREENRAEGSYFVVLPDGTKQTVDYEADERGFKPRISVEAADASARSNSGYDENAAEITAARSAEGPY